MVARKSGKGKKTSKALRKWREKQGRGKIMKPKTFSEIEEKAKAEGKSAKSAKKIAGAAYWKTAKAKFKKSRKSPVRNKGVCAVYC